MNGHWWKRWLEWLEWLEKLEHHHKHKHRHDFFFYIKVDGDMANAITIVLGDGLPHAAVATVLNLDGSAATDVKVAWSGDNDAFGTIDPGTGAITAVADGVFTVTGTGVRGMFTHSDSATITVTSSATGADFTLTVNAS